MEFCIKIFIFLNWKILLETRLVFKFDVFVLLAIFLVQSGESIFIVIIIVFLIIMLSIKFPFSLNFHLF